MSPPLGSQVAPGLRLEQLWSPPQIRTESLVIVAARRLRLCTEFAGGALAQPLGVGGSY